MQVCIDGEEVNQLCRLEPGVSLQPIWSALLDIYKVFDDLCLRHGLSHYVAYGTLLGAIRHKGFIPWDDDFDVCMPRKDYERFLLIASKELPSSLEVKIPYITSGYNLDFAKVVNVREDVLAKVQLQSKLDLPQGLFIDIFPLDGYPKFPIFFYLWAFVRGLLRRLHLMHRRVGRYFVCMFDYNKAKCVGYVTENFDVLRKRLCDARSFGQGFDVSFGNVTIRIPSDSDKVLRMWYGDYMKLPPEEARKPSHQVIPH